MSDLEQITESVCTIINDQGVCDAEMQINQRVWFTDPEIVSIRLSAVHDKHKFTSTKYLAFYSDHVIMGSVMSHFEYADPQFPENLLEHIKEHIHDY